jgi:hypothetical protein
MNNPATFMFANVHEQSPVAIFTVLMKDPAKPHVSSKAHGKHHSVWVVAAICRALHVVG